MYKVIIPTDHKSVKERILGERAVRAWLCEHEPQIAHILRMEYQKDDSSPVKVLLEGERRYANDPRQALTKKGNYTTEERWIGKTWAFVNSRTRRKTQKNTILEPYYPFVLFTDSTLATMFKLRWR